MKVEFLKGLNLDDDVIKQIQTESGKDITAEKTKFQTQIDSLTEQVATLQGTVSQRDTDLEALRQQLVEAGQSSAKLSQVQQSLTELQSKYDSDMNDYKQKIENQAYDFSIREAVSGVKFSCNAAKNEFIRTLSEKKLPMQDGKLLGFADYLKAQMEADPDAFKTEQNNQDPPQFAPPPQSSPNPQQQDKDDFGFNFIGVRKKPE